ncbi:hypothetical protein [unidentified bacterial endosymbiont]|uniref:hypothetical protein n=1 Tax=unidentified bacterial endosymbiont TaxID=2355 RepID=UPI00209E0C4B|nr:hypothetical protein [unidentified bacterial endosymbiont]
MVEQYRQPSTTPDDSLPHAQARLQRLLQQQCMDFSSSDTLPYRGHRAENCYPYHFLQKTDSPVCQ